MEGEWASVVFEVLPYKDTGTYIVKVAEEISQLLDDHIVMTQTMSFSPYKKPFEERISSWESKLRTTQVSRCLQHMTLFDATYLSIVLVISTMYQCCVLVTSTVY